MRWIRSKVCFVEGTLVLTIDADGNRRLRPIETLREGDLVLAREEYGVGLSVREILATSRRLTPGLLHVHFAGGDGAEGTISCTDEHPFWVANRNADQPPAVSTGLSQIAAAEAVATVRTAETEIGSWVPAKHLQPGDQLTSPEGQRLTITSIDDETLANWQPVYNLTVAEDATYFVSPADRPECPLLVHNAAGCGASGGGKPLHRPHKRKAFREKVENAAPRTPDGRAIDPNLKTPINGRPHFGHVYGREHRRLLKEAEAMGMTQKQFNDWINAHSQWFQLEDPISNMSHLFEKPGG